MAHGIRGAAPPDRNRKRLGRDAKPCCGEGGSRKDRRVSFRSCVMPYLAYHQVSFHFLILSHNSSLSIYRPPAFPLFEADVFNTLPKMHIDLLHPPRKFQAVRKGSVNGFALPKFSSDPSVVAAKRSLLLPKERALLNSCPPSRHIAQRVPSSRPSSRQGSSLTERLSNTRFGIALNVDPPGNSAVQHVM